ncbi:MAG: TraB/GumN family protein [Verrucomicrobiota bacterium]
MMISKTLRQLTVAILTLAALTLGLTSAQVQAEDKKACIWKLQKGDATVYLAGSVHLLRETDHPLPAAYDNVYDLSDRIYFEVDMKDMQGAQMKILQLSMLPEGESIEDKVSEETYEKLQGYLETLADAGPQFAMMKPMFDKMKPGMMAMTISSIEAVKIGAMPNFGVEMIYDTKARKDGKPVKGLETVEFQIGLFDQLDADEQDEMLAMTIDQAKETPEMLDKMIEVWRSGDAKALDEMLNKYFEEEAKLTQLLLYKRNADWIPSIEEELNGEGTTMFIVGAGHLVGKKSVIEMLEDKGYKPTQVTYE